MTTRCLIPWGSFKSATPVLRSEFPFLSPLHDVHRLFDDFLSRSPIESIFGSTEKTGVFSPRIDVDENEREIVVKAELPGIEEKDVNLALSAEALTISGEKKQDVEPAEDGSQYFESRYGSFQRVIPLSAEIDQDKVEASLKKGILKIRLPKSAQEQRTAMKISIRAE